MTIPAFAISEDWGPELGVVPGHGREAGRFGVWADPAGASRYWFRTPAGATSVDVLAVGAHDTMSLVVRRGSPDAVPECRRSGLETGHRRCTIALSGRQSQAAVWYVELPHEDIGH